MKTKKAILRGGTGGLGRNLGEFLSQEGWELLCFGRDESMLNLRCDLIFIIGVIEIIPYKNDNLTYLSQNIFLNVKLTNRHRS